MIGELAKGLRSRLPSCQPSSGIRAKTFVDCKVYNLGVAFFPAGTGLYDLERKSISTVVLGSDWGNEESFKRLLVQTQHKDEATYVGCRSMMRPVGFDVADCFFTNAWPVLRSDDMDETSYHPMRDDGPFVVECRAFFDKVLAALKPDLVIALGIAPAWFVGPLAGTQWKPSRFESSYNIKSSDLPNDPVRAESGIVYVAATHPSRISNVRYRGFTPEEERHLLRRAREMANIPEAQVRI